MYTLISWQILFSFYDSGFMIKSPTFLCCRSRNVVCMSDFISALMNNSIDPISFFFFLFFFFSTHENIHLLREKYVFAARGSFSIISRLNDVISRYIH